tara:strand:+ start:253 stop:486 length:234 start_codon:yes stop_codon:yes gene_type:complete
MGATIMKAIPGNQGESTDKKMSGMNMSSMPETTQPGDEMKMSKKKKKKKPTIMTSVMGVTEDAEVSNPSLMSGGGSY